MAFGALHATLFDLSCVGSKPEKSWHGFSSCFLLLAAVPDGKQYIRFAFPFQSCSTAQGLNVVIQFVLPLPFSSLHRSLRKTCQTAAFTVLDLWRVGCQCSGKPKVTHKQGDIAFMLYPFTIKFLLSNTIMKILRVQLIWCRILFQQLSSRASYLRMTYEIVQN